MIHSNHIRSNKQYWHDTNQCCQQRQCLRDVLLASWGRLFRFREINPRTKADWIKGFGWLLLLHHYWRRRWEWVQLSTINASPLLKATRRIWTSTLWHRKKWKRRRKYPRNCAASVPDGLLDVSSALLWSVMVSVRACLHGGHKGCEDDRSHSSSSWSPSNGQRHGLSMVPPPQSESSSCWKQLSVSAMTNSIYRMDKQLLKKCFIRGKNR